ncbi:hypothetical protein K8R66_00520 [bacterium]|nr:hypothetical protein [bacterium]
MFNPIPQDSLPTAKGEKVFVADNNVNAMENSSSANENHIAKEADIHYMPEKFLKPEGVKRKSNNVLVIFGVIILALVVVGVAIFAFIALRGPQEPNEGSIINLPPSEETEKDKPKEAEKEVENTPETRDQKRIDHIFEIRSALSIYKSENNIYPNRLSYLKNHLKQIPQNPEPGGEEYYYESLKNGQDYILTFVLEEGSDFGNLILEAGKFELKPDSGIQIYNENQVDPDEEEDDDDQNNGNNSGLLPIPEVGKDTDKDSLTDSEELLFGTEINIVDTDEDGYNDGEEIINLYDPTQKDSSLADNIDLVRFYNNELYNYSVLYPSKWIFENKTADFSETIFYNNKSDDFFKIQVNSNPQSLSLRNWYLSISPGTKAEDLDNYVNANVFGIRSKDKLNVYISNKDKIYVISYIIVDTENLDFLTTFEMFLNSFRFIEE